jgi:hypothetical protein
MLIIHSPLVAYGSEPTAQRVEGGGEGVFIVYKQTLEALAKVLNFNVAANFSLRVFFVFNALQTQANPECFRGCGYKNWTFAKASLYLIIKRRRIFNV